MLLYVGVFIVLIVLALGYTQIARFFNIVDVPNKRSSHSTPVIRGGGILFYFSALLFFVLSDFEAPGFMIGLSILAILSFTDDILTLKARLRLPFQFLAIFCILHASQIFFLPVWALLLISVVAVGFINIYNFMDGINGITGLYSLAVLHGFWITCTLLDSVENTNLIIFTGFSLLVFGYFNFRKQAKFFAGDVGSVSMAAIVFFIGLNLILITESPLIIGFVLVYGIDAGFTLVRRLFLKENIFKPHRRHLYQILVDRKGFSHMKVASGYALIQVVINHVIYFSISLDLVAQTMLLIGLFVGLSAIYFLMLYRLQEESEEEKLEVSTN